MIGGERRGEKEIHAEVGSGARALTHVSNSRVCGGSHVDESDGVEREKSNGIKGRTSSEGGSEEEGNPFKCIVADDGGENNNTDGGDMSNAEGGEHHSSPTKIKKRKKKNGPEAGKKKENTMKKKNEEGQQANNDTPLRVIPAMQQEPHGSYSLLCPGVVRNPLNHLMPSTSGSATSKDSVPASQVESIGDSGIMMGNNRFEKYMERSKAEKMWSFAKDKLGVSTGADDDEIYIEKIKAMEERDMNVKGRKGKTQVSK